MTPGRRLRRSSAGRAAARRAPVVFTAGDQRFRIAPQLGVEADWQAAVAARSGRARASGPSAASVASMSGSSARRSSPRVTACTSRARYKVGQLATAIDRPQRAARLGAAGSPSRSSRADGRRLDRSRRPRTRSCARSRRSSAGRRSRCRSSRTATGQTPPSSHLPPAGSHGAVRSRAARPRRDGWRLPRWRIAELLTLPREARRRRDLGPGRSATSSGFPERSAARRPTPPSW